MPAPPKHPFTSEEIARFQAQQGSRYIQSPPSPVTHTKLFSMEVVGAIPLLKSPEVLVAIPDIQQKLTECAAAPPADAKAQALWYTLEDKGNGKTLVTYWYQSALAPRSPLK